MLSLLLLLNISCLLAAFCAISSRNAVDIRFSRDVVCRLHHRFRLDQGF